MLLAQALRSAAAGALRSPRALLRPAARLPRGPPAAAAAAARPFTRSLWLLCGEAGGPRPSALLRPPPGLSFGCGGLHTEGDKVFSEFLMDEIKQEKKIQKHKSLPEMSGGWELEVQGTEAKLLRNVSGEKISVTFNINNSIPPVIDEEPQEGQKADEQESDLTSTPNFVVEVTKDDSKNTLVFDCHFPENESGNEGEEESDIFAIQEVSFQPSEKSDWKETNFTLNTDSLDWALYDHLMDFLADRGVDNTFADELVELSTALEHQEYIKFLEDLKGFVKCQ